ncbi:MAG: UDP-N-acetylmuramoyl-tripeptide--D-alanyl-D-alanine ligase [Chlamydiae bacterium]|nr:UDP-N-acetylmuramoyl-tripeptide--D-alanyl-D-alanine ligase [Chlamydiota bacterium]
MQQKYKIDHREVEKGDIFVAIKGQKVDGHDFVKKIAPVASLAIVQKKLPDCLIPQLVVKDPILHLQKLAKEKLEEKKPLVCAITGAFGKTSAKDLLFSLVSPFISCARSLKSHNTKISLPLTILNELQNQELLILEKSMTHKGDLERLVDIAPAHFVLTTAMPKYLHHYSHAKNFATLEGMIQAKQEIFASKNLSFAITQDDDFKAISPRHSYSVWDKQAEFFAKLEDGLEVYHHKKCVLKAQLDFPKHHLPNLLGSIAMAFYLGLSFEQIKGQLEVLSLPSMRFEQMEKKGHVFINDAYNASPYTFAKAFENLPKAKRKFAILGHMPELGKETKRGHHEVLEKAKEHFDYVFCIGSNWDREKIKTLGFYHFLDQNECIECILNEIQQEDLLFFKGARSLYLEDMLQAIKQKI